MKCWFYQCQPHEDGEHIPLAKFLVDELQNEYALEKAKNICIILHLERLTDSAGSSWQFSFLSGWRLLVVDSLEDQTSYPLTDILMMTVCDLLKSDFYPIKQCISENLIWCFACTSSSSGDWSVNELSELINDMK